MIWLGLGGSNKDGEKRCVQSTAKLGPVDELYGGDGQTKVGVRDISQVF